MNKLQFNRMATTVLFAVLVLVSSVALAQKPIKRPPKKVRQTTTQQVAKPLKMTVAPAKPTNEINGLEWVDLGLSVKWATMNVFAVSPDQPGDYYAWGDLEENSEFTVENCETMGLDLPDISGNEKYDIARALWGGSWRMPTYAEFKELKEKCKWEWTKMDDFNGMKVTGPNGNSIFLPAAGWRNNNAGYQEINQRGCYWSSSPYDNGHEASAFIFNSENQKEFADAERACGFQIRPVTE